VSVSLWRVFPYRADASAGDPFSASCLPRSQGAGRFDIPESTAVWYLAESPTHAVAEVIQGLRNQRLDAEDLLRFGYPLALVPITLTMPFAEEDARAIVDLCDPAMLDRYGIRPDVLASWDFTRTQQVARQLFADGCLGFRWWSALSGAWHTTVLFNERLAAASVVFGTPAPLTPATDAVIEAARRLAIDIPSKR